MGAVGQLNLQITINLDALFEKNDLIEVSLVASTFVNALMAFGEFIEQKLMGRFALQTFGAELNALSLGGVWCHVVKSQEDQRNKECGVDLGKQFHGSNG